MKWPFFFRSIVTYLFIGIFGVANIGCSNGKHAKEIDNKEIPEPYLSEAANQKDTIDVCSFNIQFLGMSTARYNKALTDILKGYDIVVVQELVSPPYDGIFPDGTSYKPDSESAGFFDGMKANGFSYKLSEEDTGTGDKIHINSSATEWWVAFYKPDKVSIAADLPNGFISDDRSNHDDYERVPYAFPFRTADDNMDFVLISVHLQPGKKGSDKQRRKHELSSIESWIRANNEDEKDFIILGDMNIYDASELTDVTPEGFLSLNDECRPTNTNVNGPLPYDHVMYDTTYTKNEIDRVFDLHVINLIVEMERYWANISTDPYPGKNPYKHDEFRKYFSDHHPVVFKMVSPADDDD